MLGSGNQVAAWVEIRCAATTTVRCRMTCVSSALIFLITI